jgi:signal transduction histidine kinase/ligand-binding sensor domain-containing protein
VQRRPFALAASLLFVALELAALPADRAISQYVRESWTVERGLPHGTVRGFAQSSDGYLWLATYEGLVRFNGEAFRVFDRTSTPGLSNASIDTLCRTNDDTLWLGTFDGLVRYRKGRFDPIPIHTDVGIIKALAPARDGSVWAGTRKGKILRVVNGEAQTVSLPLPLSPITALATTGTALWIGTSHGLFRYDQGKLDAISTDTVLTLLADDGALLVGTNTNLKRIANDVTEVVAGLPSDQITALARDRDRNLWVGTYGNGVFRIANGRVDTYTIADGLLNPTIRAIFEDDEGSIWIGSQNGLEQLRTGAFVTWNERHGLADVNARAIFEDVEGVMWAGTATSLNRLENGKWVRVADDRLSRILAIAQSRDGAHWFGTTNGLYRIAGGATKLYSTAQGLSHNTIRDIHEDRRGDVWVGTDFGLNRIRANGTVESFAERNDADYAMAITETPDGRVWAATGGGLVETNGTSYIVHAAPRELPSNRLFGIESDDEGTVWIATEGDGVVRFQNGKARAITMQHGMPTDKILSLVDDKKGNLWFGTVRGAFVVSRRELNAVADGKLQRIQHAFFDESDGLGSRQCNGAANPSAFRSRDGRIWLVTAHGVSALTNARPAEVPHRAPIIERVTINGQDVAAQSLDSIGPNADRIEFAFTGVTFTTPERVHFAYRLEGYDDAWIDAGVSRVASYTNLPAGDYKFVVASSRGTTSMASGIPFTLTPHFFETRTFIALCIIAAIALLFAAHSFRLHLTHERARLLERLVEDRTRQINEEKERTEVALRQAEAAKREAERHEQLTEEALAQAEEANRAKSIFLAATSHELRTPLNAIIGFSEILMQRVARQLDPRYGRFLHNIHASGEYLLGIINNILDLSKIEAGRMEIQPEPVSVRELVDGIANVMKGVTALRKIHIDVDVPDDLPIVEADATLLKQIVYNLMSNAVKFSPERSHVTVSARHLEADDAVEIRVRDRGIGIDPRDQQIIFEEFRQASGGRREGTGLGLALVKRFVGLHRGTIHVESTPGEGSTFIITIPVTQSVAALRA